MTPEQSRALAVFLRQHLRNLANLQVLRATMELSGRRVVPLDWEHKLEAFGQRLRYRAMIRRVCRRIVQFERGASETGLIELLEKTLQGRTVK